jgi:hypothetical protein
MPNHCYNKLTIGGSRELVDRLKEAVNDGDEVRVSAHKIIPMPFELRCYSSPVYKNGKLDTAKAAELVAKYGAENWYDWAIKNWGTKWGMYEFTDWEDQSWIVGNEKIGSSSIVFNSAWSPPSLVIKALSIYFPDLSVVLEYCEPGMQFAGKVEFHAGVAEDVMEVTHAAEPQAYNDFADLFGLTVEDETVEE